MVSSWVEEKYAREVSTVDEEDARKYRGEMLGLSPELRALYGCAGGGKSRGEDGLAGLGRVGQTVP